MRTIRAAVEVHPVNDQIYMDDLTKRRSKRDHLFIERDACIRHTRACDTIVVASAGMIGIGRDDVRAVLHQLYAKGIPLLDASTGKTVMLTEEVADNLAFVERAEKEYKALVAANARASRRNGRPAKVMKVTEAEAEAMWRDTTRYPSQKDVASAVGLSVRSMYFKYKKRHPVPLPVKKKPKPIVAADGRNFVYVMWRSDGCHKIGFSTKLTLRLRTLSDIFKQPLRLVHYVDRPGDGCAAEQIAHAWIAHCRRDGEWFEADEAKAIAAVTQACEFLDISKAQAKRVRLIETAEKELGRPMTRPEINAYFKGLEQKDESDE
jgi:hypothetical protein